jgi:2-isopropylmalate synthase
MNTTPSESLSPRHRAPHAVEIFDTTLRDGSQLEGISLTVGDKLRIAEQLDHLGVHFIEGGWPGANPKDEEFFRRARTELQLATSTLVAFGSTRRVKGRVDEDPTLRNLVEAGTSAVCIVGKAWDYHVTDALQTTLAEGIAMVSESVDFLKQAGLRVFFDAEHFFDGFRNNPEFAFGVLEGAVMAGVDCLVLCDTNGGSLPFDIEHVVGQVYDHFPDTRIGIHLHNDTGCGVANALAAVRAGASHVQGTINGYGERVGNCDLVPIIANLSLKMGIATLPEGRLERLTAVSHHIAEIVNFTVNPQQPYVGSSAFAHKAGLHTSAISRRKDAYEHIDPALVGNGTRFLVSEMSGRSTLELKARELGLTVDGKVLADVVDQLKRLEHEGFHFEAADASLELLMRRATGWQQDFFSLESYKVLVRHLAGRGPGVLVDALDVETEATVKLWMGDERVVAIGEGNGPVNALDAALRLAIGGRYPALERITLTDFKVRVLDTGKGTGAITRVLLDSTNGLQEWTTIGVSENIIEASWQALSDSLIYGLLHTPS